MQLVEILGRTAFAGDKKQVKMEDENLAFEELSKLSVNDSSTSIESTLKKENFNVVFVGHVGKSPHFPVWRALLPQIFLFFL